MLSSIILLIAIALLVYSQRGTQESSESPDIFGERKAISQITELSAVESTTGSRSRVGAFGNSGFSSNVNSAVRNTGVQNSTSATDSELSRQITGCAGAASPVRCQAIQVTKEFLLADLHKHSIEFVDIHYMRQEDGTPYVCGKFRVLNSGLATARPFVSSKLSGYPVISGVEFDRESTISDTPLLSQKESQLVGRTPMF